MDDNQKPEDVINIDPVENDPLAQELSDTFDEPIDGIDDSDNFSNESWDDDIADDFYEDDVTVSHAPQKSQINWFNIGVFGFVGVTALAIIYTQFMSDPAPVVQQQAVQQTASLQEKQKLAQQALSDTTGTPNSPKGLLGNPDLLTDTDNQVLVDTQNNADNDLFTNLDTPPSYEDDIEDILSTLKQPNAPETNDIEQTDVMDGQINPLPIPTDAMDEVTLEQTDTVPTMDVIEPVLSQEKETTIVEAPISSVTEIVSIPSNTEGLNAITSQVESLDSRLDDLTSRMDEIMAKLDAQPIMNAPAPEADNAVISKLENTISKLEKRVETLSKAKAPVAKRTTNTATKKKAAPKVSKPKIVWELRGASPDQAYVAQRGTQNLRTVAVGETLDGIGRITSIAIENNRWIVRGTHGIVTQ